MATKKELESRIVELEAELDHISIFKTMVDNSLDAVFASDPEGTRFIYVNRVCYELHGYDYDKQELSGQSPQVFLADKEQFVETVIPQVMTGGWKGEVRHKRKDGSTFDASAVVFLLQDTKGRPFVVTNARDITTQKQTEDERERLQQEIIEAQQRAIAELSTPVIPIMDRIIVMPLIGSIDSLRARDITRNLLAGISQHRAKIVILDVTGVGLMDTGIVNHLNKTIQAARLKGAQTIVTGVSDAVAEAIVDLGIDWSAITTLSDLQTGLIVALDSLGVKLNRS
ncbi:MAG: PAS domain S-box protein [Anaerolineae bacterium]|nr:PAS domain S-box protein [Anaerolineae bacterium]